MLQIRCGKSGVNWPYDYLEIIIKEIKNKIDSFSGNQFKFFYYNYRVKFLSMNPQTSIQK